MEAGIVMGAERISCKKEETAPFLGSFPNGQEESQWWSTGKSRSVNERESQRRSREKVKEARFRKTTAMPHEFRARLDQSIDCPKNCRPDDQALLIDRCFWEIARRLDGLNYYRGNLHNIWGKRRYIPLELKSSEIRPKQKIAYISLSIR
jgi:hypothetical protein